MNVPYPLYTDYLFIFPLSLFYCESYKILLGYQWKIATEYNYIKPSNEFTSERWMRFIP